MSNKKEGRRKGKERDREHSTKMRERETHFHKDIIRGQYKITINERETLVRDK